MQTQLMGILNGTDAGIDGFDRIGKRYIRPGEPLTSLHLYSKLSQCDKLPNLIIATHEDQRLQLLSAIMHWLSADTCFAQLNT